ncbi:MAG: hypothetical protein P2A85_26635 [Microcoleus anatoxicus]|uniref:hypothetical protein n=1 Tax=Microcoleus anatoxicus TaxID=2705319 RepID=UPI00367218C9
MKIPSVRQGLIEAEDGKVFQLNSPKGVAWLETIGSFRYEPAGDGKPYTVRKEASAYWYGCRKIEGKVRKKYIGKSSEVNIARLEEIAEALEIPTEPRVKQVAEVVEWVAEVAQFPQVTERVAESRVTALELQVAALVKAVEALQEALQGKSESGDSQELPKVDNEVAERLQKELSNLKAENQKLKTDYATLLESSTLVTNKLRQELQEVRSQLETERTRWDELQEELDDREEICAQLRSELSDLRQKSVIASEFPESADLLNQLKARRKKSRADLVDIEAILEILLSWTNRPNVG